MLFKTHKLFFYFSIVVCIGLFLALMVFTTDKYLKNMTNIGIIIEESSLLKKNLPCITICPWRAFKTSGFHFSPDNFIQNTFGKDEIFLNSSNYNAFDASKFNVEEIQSIFFGRCYMMHFLMALKRMDVAYVALTRENDYKVFIHNCDDIMLFMMGIPPIEITSFQMGINNISGILTAQARITERHFISMSKDGSCRDSYTSSNTFNMCSRSFFTKFLKENTNCSLPGFEHHTNGVINSECEDKGSALRSMQAIEILRHTCQLQWLQHCPIPCEQKVFDAKVIRYHVNNLVGHDQEFVDQVQKHGAVLGISYETFAVHKHVETLVVDTGNFLSQIGGNLGLFLGFSCLSLLSGIIQFSRHIIRHWRSGQ